MSMFQVPKMASHPLDKYRNATIDYITGSQISLSGDLYVNGAISGSIDMSGDAITASYVTGSKQVSGSIVYADKLSANFITGSRIVSKGSISGSSVTISGPVSGSSMWTTNFTGSQASITNIFVAGRISGSDIISGAYFQGLINYNVSGSSKGLLILTATSGSITHGLGAAQTFMSLSITGSPTVIPRDTTLSWYPVGTTTCYICQSGSEAPAGTVVVAWKAEL